MSRPGCIFRYRHLCVAAHRMMKAAARQFFQQKVLQFTLPVVPAGGWGFFFAMSAVRESPYF